MKETTIKVFGQSQGLLSIDLGGILLWLDGESATITSTHVLME